MITDDERASIEASADACDVESWRGLDSSERDLLRRALAPAPTYPADDPSAEVA